MFVNTCYLTTCRDMVFAAILAAQQASLFTYNGFTVQKAYIPFQKIEDPATQAGNIFVIGCSVDDTDRKTRAGINPLVTREVCVQVAYQESNVSPGDVAKLDNRLLLREQFLDCVKNFDYTNIEQPAVTPLWTRNETLRDENGVPFHYYMLREAATFETYFTAYFKFAHQ